MGSILRSGQKEVFPMIDRSALRSLTYGLYLIAARAEDGRRVGCVANTLVQVASDPITVAVSLNKGNATTDAIRRAGRFAASVLAQSATMELIGTFGFKSSLEFDKFADVAVSVDAADVPCVTEHAVAVLSVRVRQTVDAGTHLLFVGEVEEARKLADDAPMTYAYYHEVLRGKTPPKAASYLGDSGADGRSEGLAAKDAGAPVADSPRCAWRCTVCGHIEYVDELPDDFECPICGVGKEMFERIEL